MHMHIICLMCSAATDGVHNTLTNRLSVLHIHDEDPEICLLLSVCTVAVDKSMTLRLLDRVLLHHIFLEGNEKEQDPVSTETFGMSHSLGT